MSPVGNVMRLLGLARRAGALAHGAEGVRRSIRDGEAKLVLLASDASPAQLDKIRRTLAGRPTARTSLTDRDGLGRALGLPPVSAVAVTSGPLADRIAAELGQLTSPVEGVQAAMAAAEE